MEEWDIQKLPSAKELSPSILSFLDNKLSNGGGSRNLASELQSECAELDRSLIDLNRSLAAILVAHSSFSDRIHSLLLQTNAQLGSLRASTSNVVLLGKDLPALAQEVARLDDVRFYAETALKLDTLVGDIEDAVSSAMNRNLRKLSSKDSEDVRLRAIKTLNQTEDILTSIATTRPKWGRLLLSVDHRVDRALAILRPQAIADHRALLTSLGWPPPLSSSTSTILRNPLLTMQRDLKTQYCETFFALCSLQLLQRRRKSRQLAGYHKEDDMQQPLWVIEELVNPIALASQRHFLKWVDKPEFIFALVYKITRDYVDSMDELLQPLVDEAMLSGYSCREEWISGMISSLSTYLAKEVFPKYVAQLDEENNTGAQSRGQPRTAWLHLINLMVSCDKQFKSLLEHSGILLSFQEGASAQKISSLSVFLDRPEWLELWAEIELGDILEKLNNECNDERNWTQKSTGENVSSESEDYKAPAISSVFLWYLSTVIDRCRSLPNITMRSRFLRLTGAPIVKKFLDCLLQRCQEAEGLTAMTDNDALVKVANSINACRSMESVLKEWCEDVFFLELGFATKNESDGDGPIEGLKSGDIFDAETGKLEAFRHEWVEKISVVTLRGFDSLCREYIKNKRQWQEKNEEGSVVSRSLVSALDNLQAKMSVVEVNLNAKDFAQVWRSLASGIDRLFFTGVLSSNAKFHDGGVERLRRDLDVLFGVFRAWCLRPEGFFPKASNGLKLLTMPETQLKSDLLVSEKWLKANNIDYLNMAEADRIMKSRVFHN